MKTSVKRLYEAMFLVDSALAPASPDASRGSGAQTDWDSISSAAKKVLEKAGAEIVLMKKWDERKLAYEIAGRDRGTYILCYFHADGQNIRQIERDAQLSEKIMRVLILGTEGRDKECIERDIASQPAAGHSAGPSRSAGKKPCEAKADEARPVGAAATGEGGEATAAATPSRRKTKQQQNPTSDFTRDTQ